MSPSTALKLAPALVPTRRMRARTAAGTPFIRACPRWPLLAHAFDDIPLSTQGHREGLLPYFEVCASRAVCGGRGGHPPGCIRMMMALGPQPDLTTACDGSTWARLDPGWAWQDPPDTDSTAAGARQRTQHRLTSPDPCIPPVPAPRAAVHAQLFGESPRCPDGLLDALQPAFFQVEPVPTSTVVPRPKNNQVPHQAVRALSCSPRTRNNRSQ